MEKKLRFKVGDLVLAKCGENLWKEAYITELWSQEERGLATYRMCTLEDNEDIYTTIDSIHTVRAYTESGLPRVIQEIECGGSWENVEELITSYSIDVSVVGPNLLIPAATVGNDDVVMELIGTYGVSESVCDKDGRNILHIALLHKHFDLVEVIREDYEDLFLKADNKGMNVIHYLIMSKNVKLLQEVLYDDEFFEDVSTYTLANLVDPTYERYDDVKQQRAVNFITPLEWAKRMKQVEMVKVLEKYINELRIIYKLSLFSSSTRTTEEAPENAEPSKDQTILQKLMVVDGLITEWGLQKTELVKLWDLLVQVSMLANICCKHGYIKSLAYIVDDCFASLLAFDLERYTERLGLLVQETIYGPEKQAFPTHSDRSRMEMHPGRWARDLSFNYINWSAKEESVLDFTIQKLAEWKAPTRYSDSWDEMLKKYMEKLIIAGTGGMLVTERAEVLKFLLTRKLPHGGHVVLPVHSFVIQGQLHLLQWAVRAGYVDLKSPVGTCTSLVEHVRTLSWLSLETKRKNKPRGIPGDLTVAEVLCALSAGYGEFFICQWLLEEVIATARQGVTFNGRDLLYIATSQNSLIIVKYLLVRRPACEWRIVDAVKIGAEVDIYLLTKLLLDSILEGRPSLEQRAALITVAISSESGTLQSWANLERMREVCGELQRQVEADVSCEELTRYFDEQFNLSMDIGWGLSSLGSVYDDIDISISCTQIDLATDIESLLACLLTLAIRANKVAFLDHIVNALVLTIKSGVTFYQYSGSYFLCLHSQLSDYAKQVGNTDISVHLTAQYVTLVEQLTPKLVQTANKYDRKPFNEMHRYFMDGSPVEQLEECLLRQRDVVSGSPPKYEMISLAYLVHTNFEYCSQLADAGHLHIIRWVLETQRVQISLAHTESALEAAALSGRVEVVQYLLNSVYDASPPSPYLIDGGPIDLQCEERVDDEKESRVIIFANILERVARKVCALFLSALKLYAYKEENLLEKNDRHAAVLDFLLTFAVDRGYAKSITFPTFTEAFRQLQDRDHPDMWAFVRRLCGLVEARALLKQDTTLIKAVTEQCLRRIGFFRYDTKPPEARQRDTEHSAALVNYLLELGVHPDVEYIVRECSNIYRGEVVLYWEKIIQLLYTYGFDIQRIVYVMLGAEDKSLYLAASERLDEMKAAQRKQWEIFDAIAAGHSVDSLSTLLITGNVDRLKDRSGRNLLQVAAFHDRGDVILWLHREHQMDIKAVDSGGLSVLMLCRRAGSLSAARIVAEAIGGDTVRAFCWRHFHRRRVLREARAAQQLRVNSARRMQSCARGWLVRRRYAPLLREVKGSWNAFVGKWGAVMTALNAIRTQRLAPFSWAEQKFKYDMAVDVIAEDSAVQQFFDQVASSAQETLADPSNLEFSKLAINRTLLATQATDIRDQVDAVELSQAVVRWLDKADETYRAMFQKKVARLAQGSRSYALSKRLKGCEFPICESKLDAGQRILWTYISRDDKQHVLIWFVSKHDNVSHCARLIDNACARTFRSVQRTTSEASNATRSNLLLALTEDSVLLDPSRNVPMKIYIAQRSELPLLAEKAWKAPLRLNQREQGVRSQAGTVLLLGRSGTGKTLCVMDRMNHDRTVSCWQAGNSMPVPFKQLFVTRSSALCDFVRLYQQYNCAADDLVHTEYVTFENFLRRLELAYNDSITGKANLSASKKVDYLRFRDHVFPLLTIKSTRTLDALVVWTQIRSFLKGSIEAALEGGVLSLATYLDTSKFSRDRCRLLPEQRQEVYALFLQYQALHELHGWWDDMDRAMQVLRPNLSVLMQRHCTVAESDKNNNNTYDKIYVDEVQDNTQVEIALYLMTVGASVNGLFLAGDPAQSVVEGVEFRFEEVRSLVYVLSQQQEALQRPTKLLINYRSHSGILNCAGAVLGRMLAMFPGAAKTLPADEGLFLGPRPAFFSAAVNEAGSQLSEVRKLLAGNERLMVLCPDERAADVSAQLNAAAQINIANTSSVSSSNLVMGIRAAKGLEFTDIVLLDFFCAIPDSDYKAWKELLVVGGEEQVKVSSDASQQYAFPQLEPQLKLLYTAITRCINRLIFVESRRSRIGGLFFRWLKQHGLADAFTLPSEANGEHQQLMMTRDEWRMRGIDIALSAESAGDLARSEQLLGQAAQCFQRAEEPALKGVALAQAAMYQSEAQYCNGMLDTSKDSKQVKEDRKAELSPAEEVAVASTLLRGLRLGLHDAAQHLCHMLEERLDAHSKKFFVTELLKLFT